MKVTFIGGGTMAEALLGGILSSNVAVAEEIKIGEPIEARRDYLTQTYNVEALGDNKKAISNSDLIILAVKPQDLNKVTNELKTSIIPNQTALSIIAGTKIPTIKHSLKHPSIIRVMPNTPAQIGCGMSMWTCTPQVDTTIREVTRTILSSIGKEIFIEDEKYLDMATALSASGPAYVFLFLEALIDAGVYVGLPRDISRTLALQTVFGSTQLVLETGNHPSILKDMVVSPGGTTAEALQVLEMAGVPGAIVNAVNSAYQKAISLGKE